MPHPIRIQLIARYNYATLIQNTSKAARYLQDDGFSCWRCSRPTQSIVLLWSVLCSILEASFWVSHACHSSSCLSYINVISLCPC